MELDLRILRTAFAICGTAIALETDFNSTAQNAQAVEPPIVIVSTVGVPDETTAPLSASPTVFLLPAGPFTP